MNKQTNNQITVEDGNELSTLFPSLTKVFTEEIVKNATNPTKAPKKNLSVTERCGLMNSDKNKNYSKEKLYRVWRNMWERCYGNNGRGLKYYQNVSICSEWSDYAIFRDWANWSGYAPYLQIDRIDTLGDYSPDNCRWVTPSINMRNTSRAVMVNYKGNKIPLAKLSYITGMNYKTLYNRIMNTDMTVREACEKPVAKARRLCRGRDTVKQVYEINGEMVPLASISKQVGISYYSLYMRLRRGCDISEAINGR